jgi:hypothetical protein
MWFESRIESRAPPLMQNGRVEASVAALMPFLPLPLLSLPLQSDQEQERRES